MKKIYTFVMLLVISFSISAKTEVEKHEEEILSFVRLKKITVGPDDSYQGFVSGGGELFFTKATHLASGVYQQDLRKGGDLHPYLSLDADAKDPVLNLKEDLLAFTFFKFNAGGDVCYSELKTSEHKFKCIGPKGSSNFSPFWLSEHEIGFLSRENRENSENEKVDVLIYNLSNQSTRKLFNESREVWDAEASSDGHWLVFGTYCDKSKTSRCLNLLDLINKKETLLKFDLPGIPGFPRFSKQNDYLYFAHFMNDTNGDQVIDGKDFGVIFRYPLNKIVTNGANLIFPEQLTSVENNCSFPIPQKDKLYVTCAFEGSLDIYELPLSGLIPPNWNKAQLLDAHLSARSYQSRLLLLNKLKYLDPHGENFTPQIFSNHLYLEEWTPAIFYNKDKLVGELLSVLQLRKVLPRGVVSPQLKKLVENLHAANKYNNNPIWKSVLEAYAELALENFSESLKIMQALDVSKISKESEKIQYWALNLIEKLNFLFPGKVNLTQTYFQLMKHSKNEENTYFYALKYFNQIDLLSGEQHLKLTKEKVKEIENSNVKKLFDGEDLSYRLSVEKDEKKQKEIYAGLDKLMSETRDNYFLKRTLYHRALLNLIKGEKYFYVGFVATSWSRYTNRLQMEFSYAREQFIYQTKNKAYGFVAKKKNQLATGEFFGVLAATNDLEAHQGYIYYQDSQNNKILQETYDNLKKRNFLGDTAAFVDACMELYRSGDSTKINYQAIANVLETYNQKNSEPTSYLLLGYLYQRLKKYSDAHTNYMLAFDLAGQNERIRASALENLGELHFQMKNFGQAANFLEARLSYPFLTLEDESFVRWIYARSLFHLQNFRLSYEQTENILLRLKLEKNSSPLFLAFLERAAFYAYYANNYEMSVKYYKELLGSLSLSPQNEAKFLLMLGAGLNKLQQPEKAMNLWKKALSKNPLPRTRLIILGMLAKRDPSFLSERLSLLREAISGKMGFYKMNFLLLTLIKEELPLLATNKNNFEQLGEDLITFSKNTTASDWQLLKGLNQFMIAGIHWKLRHDSVKKIESEFGNSWKKLSEDIPLLKNEYLRFLEHKKSW